MDLRGHRAIINIRATPRHNESREERSNRFSPSRHGDSMKCACNRSSGGMVSDQTRGERVSLRSTLRRRGCAVASFLVGCSVLYYRGDSSSSSLRRSLALDGQSVHISSDARPLLKLMPGGQRLGDQLFMYASHLSLAETHNMDSCVVKTDQRLPMEQIFVGPMKWCEDENYGIDWVGGWRSEKINELRREDNDANLVYGLSGYMHAPRNFVAAKTPSGSFVDYSDLLYDKLRLRTDTEWYPVVERMLREGQGGGRDDSDEIVKVGIHVRRGDKVDNPKYTVADAEYYRRAMEYFRERYNRDGANNEEGDKEKTRVYFFVTSDSTSWVDANPNVFGSDDIVLMPNTAEDGDEGSNTASRDEDGEWNVMIDLALLIECDHIIISGGGFGFWAAYLGAHRNGGEVIIGSAQEHLKSRTSSLEEWTNIDEMILEATESVTVE